MSKTAIVCNCTANQRMWELSVALRVGSLVALRCHRLAWPRIFAQELVCGQLVDDGPEVLLALVGVAVVVFPVGLPAGVVLGIGRLAGGVEAVESVALVGLPVEDLLPEPAEVLEVARLLVEAGLVVGGGPARGTPEAD